MSHILPSDTHKPDGIEPDEPFPMITKPKQECKCITCGTEYKGSWTGECPECEQAALKRFVEQQQDDSQQQYNLARLEAAEGLRPQPDQHKEQPQEWKPDGFSFIVCGDEVFHFYDKESRDACLAAHNAALDAETERVKKLADEWWGMALAAERAWKESMLRLEATWDEQEVGRLLGLTLGQQIRSQIAMGIKQLHQQLDAERTKCKWYQGREKTLDAIIKELQQQLAAEQKAIAEHNERWRRHYPCKGEIT